MTGSFRPAGVARDVAYAIHLPPPSSTSDAALPILYFLHGFRDDESIWTGHGLAQVAEALFRGGRLSPMAVALCDGAKGFYTNAFQDGAREEDAVFPHFVELVEAKLLRRRARVERAIAGISMGGYGAVKIALKHPGDFAAAGALSGVFLGEGAYPGEAQGGSRARRLRRIFGPPGDRSMRDGNDVYRLLDSVEPARAPSFYLACGDDDRYGFDDGAVALGSAMLRCGLDVQIRIGPGGHDYSFWRRELPGLLLHVGRTLAAR